MGSSLPQKIGNLVQRAAHAQQLILAKDDQAFIVGIVCSADELDDFGVHRYALAAIVGHHNEGDHGLSFGENFTGALNIRAPCALTLPSAAQMRVAGQQRRWERLSHASWFSRGHWFGWLFRASAATAGAMNPVILVMSGGAIGAALRYGLSRALPVNVGGWPWPTFAANLLGGLAMGLLAAWLVRGDGAAEPLRLFLGVGVLGGFTTFSAFSLEMAQMVQRGQGMMAAAYAAVSVILALGAVFAGMMLARTIWT
jgi:CrcB protein